MAQIQATHDAYGDRKQQTSARFDPDLITGSVGMMTLEPAPIEPSWILSGNPIARLARHSEANDEAASTAIWDCTAGEFRWYFGWDETVYILEGEVTVTSASGNVQILKAGDIAYFKGGTWATWKIDKYLRKIAFLRRPMPMPVALVYKLRNLMRGQAAKNSAL